MPPIRIHRDAPIAPTTAAKADGITPHTASDTHANPPPTTRTTPAHAPATTTASSSDPPAPQPGARPLAPTISAQTIFDASSPAPPQAGPTATVVTTETRLGGPPSQFTQPSPNASALAGRSTTTSTTPSKPGPTTLNYGLAASPYQTSDTGGAVPTGKDADSGERRSLEHPPGYVQAPDNAPYTAGGGIVGAHTSDGERSSEGGGATAWTMLSKAGEALKKGEEAAWRAVRKK